MKNDYRKRAGSFEPFFTRKPCDLPLGKSSVAPKELPPSPKRLWRTGWQAKIALRASQGSAKMTRSFLRRQGYAGQMPWGASLGLILWLTLAGTAAANREKTFDLFTFRKAAEAPQAWKACKGAPKATYKPTAPAGIRFTGRFGPNTDRVYWDRAVSLDLRG